MGPPIQIFLTSIASAPALRQRQEHLLRILQVKKIPFTSYDLASDEEAKKLWRRKSPTNNANLPGILVGGEFAGTYAEFEDAVEFAELDQFFKLNEPWNEEDEALAPAPSPQKPIGVPGVATPSQMTGQKPSFSPLPSKPLKKSSNRTQSIDMGSELSGFGLEGVKLSEEEMLELVESLGMGGEDADELVKGLGLTSSKTKSEKPTSNKAPAPDTSSTSQADTSPSGTAGPTVTTAAPGDSNVSGSKYQAGEPQSTSEKTGVSRLNIVSESKDANITAKSDNTAPDAIPPAKEAMAKDIPTSGTDSKISQPDVPASAVALPNDGTQLPSATDHERSAIHPPPQDNIVPKAPAESSPQSKVG